MVIRTLDENYKTTNILWAVSAFPGGSMDSNKLCIQLLAQTASLNKFGVTADEEFMKKRRLHDSNKIHPQSPPFFKCCILDVVDFKDKNLTKLTKFNRANSSAITNNKVFCKKSK